jgi:hypothetical protein
MLRQDSFCLVWHLRQGSTIKGRSSADSGLPHHAAARKDSSAAGLKYVNFYYKFNADSIKMPSSDAKHCFEVVSIKGGFFLKRMTLLFLNA